MALAKRIFLFLLVNILVVSVISFLLYAFNIQPYLTRNGLNYGSLAAFCFIWGMGGAFISLALSKVMAKWMMGLKIIDPNTLDPSLRQLVQTIYQLSSKAGLPKMPEVAIYESAEVNAFATGPSKSNSLVAVSTGLLRQLQTNEVEAVLGHEVTHIANGDMVTMTLLQGIVNVLVMFLARIVAFFIGKALSKDREEGLSPFAYQITVFFLEIVLMIFGTIVIAAFSRRREFRADLGGAKLSSPQNMVLALQALQRTYERQDPSKDAPSLQAFKISTHGGVMRLFSTHPPLAERIATLKSRFRIA